MQKSDSINELATALSKAQGELEAVTKDKKGYGYNYASLAETIQVSKPVLAKHGLSVTQLVSTTENNRPAVETILLHSSGQWIKGEADLPLIEMKQINEAQRAGAVYSYLRRYALQAILGMSSEDTDATSTTQAPTRAPKKAADPGSFKMPFGKTKGLTLDKIGRDGVNSALQWVEKNVDSPNGAMADFIVNAKAFLGE